MSMAAWQADGPPSEQGPSGEPPLDLGRAARALRRSRIQLGAGVLIVTAVVLGASLMSPERFRASARIADDPASAEALDTTAADRRLATSSELVTGPAVLTGAARRVSGETAASLARKVSSAVDTDASILDVVATDRDPEHAARIANAVADTFLADREQTERLVLARARERIDREIDRLRRAGAATGTIDAFRERLSELTVSELMAGSGLRLVQSAAVPAGPYAPQPVRSAVLAFFAALFAGVPLALARDRMRPRMPDARALGEAAGLPLIAALPVASGSPRRRLARLAGRRRADSPPPTERALIEEAALQATVRAALPPRAQRLVLLHGAGRADEAGLVATALARSLAWAGHSALLVRVEARARRRAAAPEPDPDVPVVRCTDLEEALSQVRGAHHRYVVVHSPHPISSGRLSPIVHEAAAVILVARLGRASAADAAAARRLIDALGLHGLGLVVTCSAAEAAAVGAAGFASPLRLPGRSRAAAANGHRRGAAPVLAAAEPD